MSTASDASALTADGTAAYKQQVDAAASALPGLDASSPTVGLLRDVDLDGLFGAGTVQHTVPYDALPHYPASDGAVTIGTLGDTQVVDLPQDLHLYEGHTPREVTFPVRMLATAGVDTLMLAAPAGGVTSQVEQGALMLLTDHINFQGHNPLVGPNVEAWGPRFPDMTEPYDASLRRWASEAARAEGLSLQKGIYLGLLGPHRETTAEHRMARRLGADAVGTGVVPEVIAARHMGVDVLALALLTAQHSTEGPPPNASRPDDTPVQTGRSKMRRLLTTIIAGDARADSQ